MERGGISRRLIQFVNALVAHLRGGLLQVMIVSICACFRIIRIEER